MNIYGKLLNIQAELKAPKGQYNSFGKYKYRSCEDILEAIKPLCKENKAILTLTDEVVQVGERFYVKATATLHDTESEGSISNNAWAREDDTKKGMDGSQITGTSSSYARKYALNGLFCIDDTKDADTDEFTKQNKKEKNSPYDYTEDFMTEEQTFIIAGLDPSLKEQLRNHYNKDIMKLTRSEAETSIKSLRKRGLINE